MWASMHSVSTTELLWRYLKKAFTIKESGLKEKGRITGTAWSTSIKHFTLETSVA